MGLESHPWLGDHRVAGQVLMPGAGIAELVRAAGAQGWSGTPQVEGLVLQAPLVLPESGAQRVQVVLTETSEQGLTASVYSQPAESLADAAWTLHATARIGKEAVAEPVPLNLAELQARCRDCLLYTSRCV